MAKQVTDTKERIIKAAGALYSTHGCEGTTLEDIITAAGITKGAFYHYFKSKDSLSEDLLDNIIADYQNLAASLDGDAEPIEQLRRFVFSLIELNGSGQWINCRLILRLSADSQEARPQIQDRVSRFWQWYTSFYEDLLGRCREAGQLSTNIDLQTQTKMLIFVMAGAITLEKISPEQPGLAELTDTLINILQQ
jgi:TetR/AcrR family transcriptional repressor of nem operon